MKDNAKNTAPFDTLAHSQALKKGGVEPQQAETHSTCLASALKQTYQDLYTREEMKKMLEATLEKFDARTREMNDKFDARTHEMSNEFNTRTREFEARTHAMEKNLEKSNAELKTENANLRTEMVKMNTRTISIIITILGTLIVIMGTLSHFGHNNIQKAVSAQQATLKTNTLAPKSLR